MKKYFFYLIDSKFQTIGTFPRIGIFPRLEFLALGDSEDRQMFSQILEGINSDYLFFKLHQFPSMRLGYSSVPQKWVQTVQRLGLGGMSISEQRKLLNKWLFDPESFDRIFHLR